MKLYEAPWDAARLLSQLIPSGFARLVTVTPRKTFGVTFTSSSQFPFLDSMTDVSGTTTGRGFA